MSVREVFSTRCALGHPSTSAHLGEGFGVPAAAGISGRTDRNKGPGGGQSLAESASDAAGIGAVTSQFPFAASGRA